MLLAIDYYVLRPRPYTPGHRIQLTRRLEGAELHHLRFVGMLGSYPVLSETSPRKVAQDELKARIRWRLQRSGRPLRLPW